MESPRIQRRMADVYSNATVTECERKKIHVCGVRKECKSIVSEEQR